MQQNTATATIRRTILAGHIVGHEIFGAFANIEFCDQVSNRHAVLACTVIDDEVVPQYAYLSAAPACEFLAGDLFSLAEINAIGCEITLNMLSESESESEFEPEPKLRLAA